MQKKKVKQSCNLKILLVLSQNNQKSLSYLCLPHIKNLKLKLNLKVDFAFRKI